MHHAKEYRTIVNDWYSGFYVTIGKIRNDWHKFIIGSDFDAIMNDAILQDNFELAIVIRDIQKKNS